MQKSIFAFFLFLGNFAYAEPVHRCAVAATEQARQLLRFHAGPDHSVEIDKSVTVLAPMRNPAKRNQLFDVLEVWGYIYKGQYRIRMIYARIPGDCLLMGQEILEYAGL